MSLPLQRKCRNLRQARLVSHKGVISRKGTMSAGGEDIPICLDLALRREAKVQPGGSVQLGLKVIQ